MGALHPDAAQALAQKVQGAQAAPDLDPASGAAGIWLPPEGEHHRARRHQRGPNHRDGQPARHWGKPESEQPPKVQRKPGPGRPDRRDDAAGEPSQLPEQP
jgi:hypothetical protein